MSTSAAGDRAELDDGGGHFCTCTLVCSRDIGECMMATTISHLLSTLHLLAAEPSSRHGHTLQVSRYQHQPVAFHFTAHTFGVSWSLPTYQLKGQWVCAQSWPAQMPPVLFQGHTHGITAPPARGRTSHSVHYAQCQVSAGLMYSSPTGLEP